MRKIESKHSEGKRRRRNQMVVGIVLIFVMFFSVLGYGFQSVTDTGEDTSSSGEKITYNGFTFTKQNNFWILNNDGKNFIFRTNPNEVPAINSIVNNIESYKGKPLYIYSENPEQESEIRTNLASYVLRVQAACPENKACSEDIPSKTCEDNFIIIEEGDEKIVQNENCVYITSKKEDLTGMADSFLFKVLGITP
ncbi:hypothetical protein COU59_00160 [Candidatus Pacearchaeota archaeon CG10_big_fil_rev_8_21_14_0_10_34_12]|nr:MAG: hypothetical protein COU59_00160 [Candidatus Pacearchaeota archaeon CG10_big_fil_rev_8_21_14_0_10_34_12]